MVLQMRCGMMCQIYTRCGMTNQNMMLQDCSVIKFCKQNPDELNEK